MPRPPAGYDRLSGDWEGIAPPLHRPAPAAVPWHGHSPFLAAFAVDPQLQMLKSKGACDQRRIVRSFDIRHLSWASTFERLVGTQVFQAVERIDCVTRSVRTWRCEVRQRGRFRRSLPESVSGRERNPAAW